MFDFLRALGLRPLEWSASVALTGSASPYVGDVLDAAFKHAKAVIVLLTPDEFAYLRADLAYTNEPDTKPQLQARPNVLFEAGMALGSHPQSTLLIEIGTMRPFSDVVGRHVVRLTNDIVKRQEVANRLRTAGCDVDVTGTDWHTAGDFTPPAVPPSDVEPRDDNEAAGSRDAREDLGFQYRGNNPSWRTLTITNGGDLDFDDVKLTVPETANFRFGDEELTEITVPTVPAKRTVTLRVHGNKGSDSVSIHGVG